MAVQGDKLTKTLGILGGMGPMATVYYMELIVKMTEASKDNEHIPMLVCNRTTVPDRTSFLLGESDESPLPEILNAMSILIKGGCDIIAIPCVTAHFFFQEIAKTSEVPVISMVQETAIYLKDRKVKKAGLMATAGTAACGFLQQELMLHGIETVIPSTEGQNKLMKIIYEQVKADKEVDMQMFSEVELELKERGAEIILLGCTELSLVKKDYSIGVGYLDMMELLAERAIVKCGAEVKKDRIL